MSLVEPESRRGEMVVVEQHEGPRPVPLTLHVAPQVSAAELVNRLAVIEEAMKTAMKENIDYGVIPGTGGKPTLLKPGAEKLGALFQLDVQLDNQKIWHDDGHLTVICRANVYHQPTGHRLGSGEGICTTREAKYAYRQGKRSCPSCGKETVLQSRDEGRDEFFCWAKKGGCGEKFAKGTPEYDALAAVDISQAPNPNIADTYNTVDKMASKRARIDAVLAVTGASALFTQDVEDFSADGGATGSGQNASAGHVGSGGSSTSGTRLASAAQKRLLDRLCEENGVERPNMDTITMSEASQLIEDIKGGNLPQPEQVRCDVCGGIDGAHLPDCSEDIPFA